MIYINPNGGLGNTLFQIAALHVLAIENMDTLCLLNTKKHINDLNNDIRLGTSHAEKYNYIFNKFNQIDVAPVEWKANQEYSNIYENTLFPKYYFPFQYIKPEYKREYEYIGYFQSEKYFKHRRNEVLEIFKPAEAFHEIINKYSNLFSGIGLHVRRGDYVKQHMGRMIFLEMSYYNRALSELPKDTPVLIFSDGLNWCKENFIGDRYVFIDEPDYISLYLMSKMKYFIVANSSFSWWGAWLGEQEKVCAPKEWFNNGVIHKLYEYDIIPNNWVKI